MTTATALAPSDVAQGVAELLPSIAARSSEIEKGRKLPIDLGEELAQAGLFHFVVPSEYGGSEANPLALIDLLTELSRADGSTGWCAMIGTTTSLLAASLEEGFAEQIYGGGPGVITSGVTAPQGRAEVVDGGYRVTGRWPFGSASRNSKWICGGSLIQEDGKPRKNSRGLPEIHLMMFEANQVELHDNWDTSGLRGTGSGDIEVQDAFVPEGRSVVLGGRSRVPRPLYSFPTLGLLALGVSSVSIGIGLRAVDEFLALADDKTPTGSTKSLAKRSRVQADVAKAQAALGSARAYVRESVEKCWEQAVGGQRLDAEAKAQLRLAAVNATWSAVDAVDRLYSAAGGTAIYTDSALQRCFRDVHVTTQHIMVAQPIYEVTGRVALGLDPRSLL